MSAGGGMRVVSAGDNCLDRYTGSPALERVGGNALNVAVDLSLAGVASSYAGAVGDDARGRRVLAELRRAGVDSAQVAVRKGPTGLTVVRVDAGERRFVSEDYGVSAAYLLDAEAALSLPGAVWLHGARLADAATRDEAQPWPIDDRRLSAAERALVRLGAAGLGLSYDFTARWQPRVLEALCPHLSLAFFSGDGLAEDEATAVAGRAVRLGAAAAVVTRGAAGALAVVGERLLRRRAEPVEVVDSLGAGDALIAACIAATIEGADVRAALDRGARAAAAACTHVGAWTLDTDAEADHV